TARGCPSRLAENSRLPSPLQATAVTRSVWPRRASTSCPLGQSQTCTVLSHPANTRRCPSGLNVAINVALLMPWKVRSSCPVCRSQTRRPSAPAETRCRPSLWYRRLKTRPPVPRQPQLFLTRGRIPDADVKIQAPRGEALAVGTVG